VRSGRLAEERLAEAAARVGRGRPVRARPVDAQVGLDAARRALRVEGDVRLAGPAHVVELLPEPNIAAGVHEHSLAKLLGPSADAGGGLVVVLRDAHRYESIQDEAERLLAAHPDAVVVETGLRYWRPPTARGYISTHGAGRANLEAAAEQLRGA